MPICIIFSLGRHRWEVVTYWVVYEPVWIVGEYGVRVEGGKWKGNFKFRIAQVEL